MHLSPLLPAARSCSHDHQCTLLPTQSHAICITKYVCCFYRLPPDHMAIIHFGATENVGRHLRGM
eukprot:4583653-Ditylum_brightwellii.AAC.1